jgi:nucleotide-binding universal stress UspA family protein
LLPDGQLLDVVESLEEDLAEAARQLKAATAARHVEHRLVHGPVWMELNKLAEQEQAHLVVLGKQGAGVAALFGSNTTDVVRESRAPVLVVPLHAHMPPVGRIILADDYCEVLVNELAMVREIALHNGAEVIVAHMPMEILEGADHGSTAVYDRALKQVPHRFIQAHGFEPSESIERAARRTQADLVAVLHRHRGFIGRLLDPSISRRLALDSSFPLLVLERIEDL